MFVFDGQEAAKPDMRQLEFIAKRGFNFIRIPTDYRFWTTDFDYLRPNEKMFEVIDSYLQACRDFGLHMSLNIHRAPGYCINYNELERDSLWTDQVAQDGFAFIWETFAKRYKGFSNSDLSFDLLNEPPDIGDDGFTRENHEQVMRRTIQAIRATDPSRDIVLNGICGGSEAIPELADTGTIHSGRGYTPFTISHYRASWVHSEVAWPQPTYPCMLDGHLWDRDMLLKSYQPWRDVEEKGVRVHIGEFGCYNQTPNGVALSWLSDLLSVYHELKWGYALWNFEGPFGIVEHGRPDTKVELIDGFHVDRALLELLLENMVI